MGKGKNCRERWERERKRGDRKVEEEEEKRTQRYTLEERDDKKCGTRETKGERKRERGEGREKLLECISRPVLYAGL